MKICVDCQFFHVSSSKCGARTLPDMVRGSLIYPYAAVERSMTDKDSCGPEAKNYKVIPVTAAA